MVRFAVTPASARPDAVSCTAARASLLYCLAIAAHLDDRSIRQRRLEARLVQCEHLAGQHPESPEFIPTEVVSSTLRKAVDEERALVPAKQHDGAEPAGPALSPSGNALLHDPAAEIGIDQAAPGASDGIAQRGIFHSLAIGEAGERLGLERAQPGPRRCPPSFRSL